MAITITSAERLEGSFDLDAIVANIPSDYTVKGMFCTRLVENLGADWGAAQQTLSAPPRGGRYMPFADYPQSDYTRLSAVVAAKKFPRVSLREAVRRVARDDLATFAGSMIGKVVLALAGDARSTLLRVPDAYARVTKGGPVNAHELDARTVRVEFRAYHGLPDYTLGQMEGVVLHYGGLPTITFHDHGSGHLVFDVA